MAATEAMTLTITNPGVTSTDLADASVAEGSAVSFSTADHFATADSQNTMTFSATLADGSPLPAGITIDTNTGVISGTAHDDFLGDNEILVTATDEHGMAATEAMTLTITNVNEAPTLETEGGTGTEDTAISGRVIGSDADVGDTLEYHINGGASDGAGNESLTTEHGTVTLNTANGEYTFTPQTNWSGTDSFNVIATDGNGGAVSQTVNLSASAVADAPELQLGLGAGSAATLPGESEQVTITSANMLTGDNGFSVSAIKLNGSAGTLSGNQYGFGVSGNASGASEELGRAGGQSEKVSVTFDDEISTANVSFGWLASDEQAHYDLFRDGVKVGEGTVNGITDNVDPTFSVSSADGGSFDQIVFSAPSGGDNDYMINSISFQKTEPGDEVVDYPLNVAASLTDTDGSESLTVSLSGLPEGAVIIDALGNPVGTDGGGGAWSLPVGQLNGLTLRVPADAGGFTLGATATSTEAANGNAVSTSVSVTVAEGNFAPELTLDSSEISVDTYAGSVANGDADAIDADANDSVTYHLLDSAGNQVESLTTPHGTVTINSANGEYVFTPTDGPAAGGSVTDTFSVVAVDSRGATSEPAEVSVRITNGDHGPVATDDSVFDHSAQRASLSVEIGEETIIEGNSSGSADWSGLTSMDDPTAAAATVNYSTDMNATYGGTNNADFVNVGRDTNASLSAGNGDDQITVGRDVNAKLELGNGNNALDVGDDINASVTAGSGNDVVRVNSELNGTIDLGGGDNRLQIGANANASISTGSGSDDVKIVGTLNAQASLGSGDDDLQIGGSATASIIAGEGNDRILVGNDVSSKVDLGSGDDFLKVSDDAWGSIDAGSGDDTVILGGDISSKVDMGSGTDHLTITGQNLWATVTGGAGTDSIELTGVTKAQWDANANGIKGYVKDFENMKFSDGQVIGDATAFGAGGSTPDSHEYTVTVTATLNDGDGSEQLSVVTLDNVPAGATLSQDGIALVANADGSYSIDVTDGQPAILTLSSQEALDLSGLTTSVTSTEELGGNTATVTVTGEGANAGDINGDDSLKIAEGGRLTIAAAELLANDSDADNDALNISAVGNANHGAVSLDADGNVVFIADEGYNGTASFEYTVSDGHGGLDTALVSLNVTETGDSGQPIGWGNGGGRDESWGPNGAWAVDGGDTGSAVQATDSGANWGNGWRALDVGNQGHAGSGDSIQITNYNRHDERYDGEAGDTLIGSAGNDYLSLEGADGQQKIVGYDHIQLGDGDEVILDMTTTTYDYGNVTVAAGAGHDVIWSASGDDLLVGGDGGNTIHGGGGNDTIVAGAGGDLLMGGDGGDTFLFDFGTGHDVVNGGAGANWTDTIDLSTNMHDGASISIVMEDQQSWTVASDGDHNATDVINVGQDKAGDIVIHSASGDETIHFTNIESIKF